MLSAALLLRPLQNSQILFTLNNSYLFGCPKGVI